MTQKFTLEQLKNKEHLKEDKIEKKEIIKEQVFSDRASKVFLIGNVKDEVSRFDPAVFDKTIAFTKFFLAEKGHSNLNDASWYTKIATNFKSEFLEFYEFFLENDSGNTDSSSYFEDFKSFFSGDFLKETERYEHEIATVGAKESNWYKGIMDAFNQEPNHEMFWDNDEYYTGYQRGTDIFRGLRKEAKLLYPVKKPRNKFVEQQQKLAKIVGKFNPSSRVEKTDIEKQLEKLTSEQGLGKQVEQFSNDLMNEFVKTTSSKKRGE